MSRLGLVAGCATLALLTGCRAPDNSWSVQTRISKSAHPFSGPWPFSVREATIICRGESKIVTLEVGGHTYALNEAARERGDASPAPITRPGASLASVAEWGEGICAMGGPDRG